MPEPAVPAVPAVDDSRSRAPVDAPSLPPPPQRFTRKFAIRLAVSLAIGAVFVWFFRRAGLDLAPPRESFAHVKWWTVGAYFALYTVVHYFRASRWDYLLRPIATVPTRRIISISFIGFLAIMVLPLRTGEVVRPYLVRQKGKISGSAAMGTIAAERVLDGLYVALLLAATMLLVPRRDLRGVHLGAFDIARVPQLGYLTVLVFGGALATLGLFLWKRALAERLTLGVVGLVSPKLARRMAQIVGGLADGLRAIPDARLMAPFTVYSALYWTANAATMWLLGWGCGLDMTLGHAFAVMGVLAMGILLPAAPGLFGAFHFAVFAALYMYFPEHVVERQGAAYVFLMYICQLAFHLVAGVVPLVTEKISFMEAFSGGAVHGSEPAPDAADEKLRSESTLR